MLQQHDLNKLPRYYYDQLSDLSKEIRTQYLNEDNHFEFNPNPDLRKGWIDLDNADEQTWIYIAYILQICKPPDIEELENSIYGWKN